MKYAGRNDIICSVDCRCGAAALAPSLRELLSEAKLRECAALVAVAFGFYRTRRGGSDGTKCPRRPLWGAAERSEAEGVSQIKLYTPPVFIVLCRGRQLGDPKLTQ